MSAQKNLRINTYKLKQGFTLIELLIAMAILGILITIAASTFTSSQMKARDAQRKSDLRQIANALEVFYNDHERYPPDVPPPGGRIGGCSYNVGSGTGTACDWGDLSKAFEDNQGRLYFKVLPKDPRAGTYFYKTDATYQKFQLYSKLENTNDPTYQSYTPDCGNGAGSCNFSVTSPNTTPSEAI